MRLSNLQIALLCSAAFAPPCDPIDFTAGLERHDSPRVPDEFRREYGAEAYPVGTLVAKSRQWRRARQTHRHKRK